MTDPSSPLLRPRISCVIPCRNEAKYVEQGINGVLAQDPPPGGFEVVIADGMSTDGTREILCRLSQTNPRIKVIDNPSRIASTGLNAAIREARGEFLVRMDCHTIYSKDYLVQCLAALEASGADNVGGPARTIADGLFQKAIAAAYHSPFAVGGARFHKVDYEGYVDTVTYGCWPKSTFTKFGYFDEELVRNQDDEHNLRINRGGGRVYQTPRIQSWYHPRATLGALFKQYLQYGYWKVRVIQKHKIPASWRHLVPAAFVLTLVLLSVLSAASMCTLMPLEGNTAIPWSSPFSWPLMALTGVLGIYVVGIILAALLSAAKSGWRLFPVLLAVFPCYHLSYGCGFLRGILDFYVRRRPANKRYEQLTR